MHLSLESLRDRGYSLMDYEHDDYAGLHPATCTDRFMEMNNARMGEDSAELTMRENRTRKVLQRRPLPSYNA